MSHVDFRVLAFGSNGNGQLGTGTDLDTPTPQACCFDKDDLKSVPEGDSVVEIVAGGNHTLLRTNSGAVFAAGNNHDSRCGLSPSIGRTDVFRRVRLSDGQQSDVERFSHISATWEASFLVEDSTRNVHVYGSGSRGELGLGEGVMSGHGIIGLAANVNKICSGVTHTVLLDSMANLYGWGSSRKQQLGDAATDRKIIWTPERIEIPFQAEEAVAGRDFTVVVGQSGERTLLGKNNYLSNSTIALFEAGGIKAGWSSIHGLSGNRARGIGRNDRGQLPPVDLAELKIVAAGSEHCIGLTTTGEIVCWGWGEHGNCGEDTDVHGNVIERWNTIPVHLEMDEVITGVGAGCATSFIFIYKNTTPRS